MKIKQIWQGSLALLWAFGCMALLVQGAVAHDATVTNSNPPAGASVTGPLSQVTVQFSEELHTKLSTLKVLDDRGQLVSEGQGHVDLDDPEHRTLIATLHSPLRNGSYTVQWHILLLDGDATDGQFQFAVAPAGAGAVNKQSPTVAPTTIPPTRAEPANPPAVGALEAAPDVGRTNMILPFCATGSFLLLGVGLVVLLRLLRKRPVA